MGHILAIESSCDETAAAVVEFTGEGGLFARSDVIASQIALHQRYGGVVPEIASRRHVECISQVVQDAMDQAGISFARLDAVGVTYAPGLAGALLVGVGYGKSLAFALGKPLIPVHHIEGHICANFVSSPGLKPPFVCLVASGGHCTIALVKDFDRYEALAATRDDAPGEAFDKISRVLGLGYPGGPAIERAAQGGRRDAFSYPRVAFADSLDFSFSGVKTAVINSVHQLKQKGEPVPVADIAASFQQCVCETLARRLADCAARVGVKEVALAGGVASNALLRELAERECARIGARLSMPAKRLCTDNAVMIGARAYFDLVKGRFGGMDLNAVPSLHLRETVEGCVM